MDIGLSEFGATLAVGAFALFSLFALTYTFFGFRSLHFMAASVKKLEPLGSLLTGVILTVILLSSGIIIEDVSNKVVDDRLEYLVPDFILKSEVDQRSRTLFGDDGERWGALARKMARNGRLYRYALLEDEETEAKRLAAHILVNGAKDGLDDVLGSVAQSVYYPSKNFVYSVPVYNGELSMIQSRVDFTRSLTVQSLSFLYATLVLFVVQLLRIYFHNVRKGKPIRGLPDSGLKIAPEKWMLVRWSFKLENGIFSKEAVGKVVYRGCLLASYYLITALLCSLAYHSEENEFNKRVYGYFGSASESQLPKMQIKEPEGVVPGDLNLGIDFSGFENVGSSRGIVVHDTKAYSDKPRLSLLDEERYGKLPVSLHWPNTKYGPSSDLESIVAVPGQKNQFLVAESGYYKGDFGRLFHVEIKEEAGFNSVEILACLKWPVGTKDIEALACFEHDLGLMLIAGVRTGGVQFFEVTLRGDESELVELSQRSLPEAYLEVLDKYDRSITDFYVDGDDVVWASAAYEGDDENSLDAVYRSAIYRLGQLDRESEEVLLFNDESFVGIELEGVKIEGLGHDISDSDKFLYTTDDEMLGGKLGRVPLASLSGLE